ncbi:MAG: superoxide dismutase [Fe] [Candidatus Neomarinimicrobiota bacterium]|nr:MAG: superoxide dismutase [Fe] [Candidatus Neomarinimicrobiota bacterium]
MEHKLPELPYSLDALEPHISRETLEYHYGKHHQAYVNNLNKLIQGTDLEDAALETIIKRAPAGGLFNNAAQVFNHSFYWNCLSPNGGGKPSGDLLAALEKAFGSFDDFQARFTQSAVTNFGSGWTWLVRTGDTLDIVNTSNAGTPVANGHKPLLTCDVWEHAYYIDYRNARPKYVEAFWQLVNWDFVAEQIG